MVILTNNYNLFIINKELSSYVYINIKYNSEMTPMFELQYIPVLGDNVFEDNILIIDSLDLNLFLQLLIINENNLYKLTNFLVEKLNNNPEVCPELSLIYEKKELKEIVKKYNVWKIDYRFFEKLINFFIKNKEKYISDINLLTIK